MTPHKSIPYEFSFGVKHKGKDVDVVHSLVRLADAQGRLWEGESIWDVGGIVERMTDFGSTTAPLKFENAPAEWKKAFAEGLFLSGARGLLDDRFYRRLLLEDQVFNIPFKYQGPVLDMAFLRNEHAGLVTVLVRVSGLYTVVLEGPYDVIDLPQIVFQISVLKDLFVNFGYEESSGNYAYDIIPRPFVMKEAGRTKNPNPLIQYHQTTKGNSCR